MKKQAQVHKVQPMRDCNSRTRKKYKLFVRAESFKRDGDTVVTGAVLEPVGIRIGRSFNGSGFKNSGGTNEMRRATYALSMANQIAYLVNEAGGITDDPFMEEHEHWLYSK